MSWMHKLQETYDACTASTTLQSTTALPPLSHAVQQAHIEVVLDVDGNFRRAQVIPKEDTVIPVTEKSATARTSGIVPHPLCDHVKYCAGDYKENAADRNEHFDAYHTQLKEWCESPYSHPKAVAVLTYVEKRSLLADLVRERVLAVDTEGHLLKRASAGVDKPPLFDQLTPEKGNYKPQNALIRWVVESGVVSQAWKDSSLQKAWRDYSIASIGGKGFCMVTGDDCVLAMKHSKALRSGKDGAKLISWKKEGESDFVYLGRFVNAGQALGVSRDVSQKAHAALQWLIRRQGYHNGDQVVVAWAVAGKPVPDPFADSLSLILAGEGLPESEAGNSSSAALVVGDVGQSFAKRLNRAMAGYRATLDPTDDVVVMGLDSATPGRMAITFYRELKGSEFLHRVVEWHEASAWHQDYGTNPVAKKPVRFVGAPSPTDIAEAAFGQRPDKNLRKLHKATIERLLPCIIDGRPVPRDVTDSAIRRTCNRQAFKKDRNRRESEWEQNLGVACALYRSSFRQRGYRMTLEAERTSRDYLYGRLFALAEHIEARALYVAGESRDTTAARLMQRFADHPASTWLSLERALGPYKTRLRSKRPAFLHKMDQLLDDIVAAFSTYDFLDDRRLSGEFLLGYHCQRRALNAPKPDDSSPDEQSTDN